MITGGGVGGFWICGSGALMVDGIGVFGQGMAVGVIHPFSSIYVARANTTTAGRGEEKAKKMCTLPSHAPLKNTLKP